MSDKEILTTELKKQHWGDGEWVNEPDSFEFVYREYICFGYRPMIWEGHNMDHLYGGYLCGYILIPESHPWHGKEETFNFDCDVHGGITHCGFDHLKKGYSIGFDCAHSRDYTPSLEKFNEEYKNTFTLPEYLMKIIKDNPLFTKTYRNIEFVKQQCRNLVDQAIEVAKK